MKGKSKGMLTSAEVAERLGAAHSSVNQWARAGRFRGARRIEIPGGHYWLIPELALEGFAIRSRGRPPKPISDLKAPPRRKQRAAASSGEAAVEEAKHRKGSDGGL
jgi:hypothetical protein